MKTAKDFLTQLMTDYPLYEGLRLEIRPLLPERVKIEMDLKTVKRFHWEVRRWFALTPEGIQEAAAYALLHASGLDLYFGVLPRRGNMGRQADVFFANWLFCDIDGGDEGIDGALQLLNESGLPSPQFVICSGGGIHCYWQLAECHPLPDMDARHDFKRILKRFVVAIGGTSPHAHADTSACEVARILRIPETFNQKRLEPRPVEILHATPDAPRFTLAQWSLDLLPYEPVELPNNRRALPHSPYTDTGLIAPGLMRWAEQGYAEAKRHKDLTGAAAWLHRDVRLSKADTLLLLRLKAAHSPGRRSITEDELEDIVRWA